MLIMDLGIGVSLDPDSGSFDFLVSLNAGQVLLWLICARPLTLCALWGTGSGIHSNENRKNEQESHVAEKGKSYEYQIVVAAGLVVLL